MAYRHLSERPTHWAQEDVNRSLTLKRGSAIMSFMDWVYMVVGAAGFLGGVGVAWGVNRAETISVRRDLERLRADFKDFQRETRDNVQRLLILRIRNGHSSPSEED